MKRFTTLIETAGRIWSDRFPRQKPRVHSLLEKVLFSVVTYTQLLSLVNLRPEAPDGRRRTFMEAYVVAWLMILMASLNGALGNPTLDCWLAGYILYELVTYRCYFVLVKSQEQHWSVEVLRRSLLMAFVNFLEAILAFAILYLRVGDICRGDTKLADPLSAVYFSVITMTTVGYGDFVPVGGLSKLLVILQVLTGLLLLVFTFPALVSLFSAEFTATPRK